jgi:hypothetical protein
MTSRAIRLTTAAMVCLVMLVPVLAVAEEAALPTNDRIRIAEGRRIADQLGDKLWPGWSDAPFAILLVTKEAEFLIYHPRPSSDFSPLGYDSLLQSDVFVRERQYDTGLLATFPAVGGVATIVIGQPKNTEASHSTRWVMTLLHEHFHQWQMSRPEYYPSVDSLGLSSSDDTGMWMLDYPFPYDDSSVGEAFRQMCRDLRDAVAGEGTRRGHVADYMASSLGFRSLLSDDDYRYYSFQLWQEGIARYTEYKLAATADVAYKLTATFEELPDVVRFGAVARDIWEKIQNELGGMSLKESRRTAFYHTGAALGVLLDREFPGWRDRYIRNRFFIEEYAKPTIPDGG